MKFNRKKSTPGAGYMHVPELNSNSNSNSKLLARLFKVIAAVSLTVVFGLYIPMLLIEPLAHISPAYLKEDIRPILTKQHLNENDYKTLYFQTGLGKPAIDEMRSRFPDSTNTILRFQENFFKEVKYICESNSLVSREESMVDENGYYVNAVELAPIHNGDILITKASHTFGWRNGHAAIIIDEINGKTLESVVLGSNSQIQDIGKWTNYPNFMLLRLKDAPRETLENISNSAQKLLIDIPYRLTVGFFSAKNADEDKITGTHCSHLVWQAYRLHGYDLDSDGGLLVTPKDLANSPQLEVVQVFGVDPGRIWP